ncbi:MAG: coproporphyrinogen III oxidase, partial [Rhodospirillales bacterium]|nr:coproporphyrinogen III oxidase [Rhodospirillales bacterium]
LAISLGPSHISAYQLIVEPGTEFHRQKVAEAPPDLGAAMFDWAGEALSNAGFPAYEISNHAAAGEECRHNLVYWQGDDYLGIGPGAHGRLSRRSNEGDYVFEMTLGLRHPAAWLKAVAETGSGTHKRQKLTASERCIELILMGLRLTDGISIVDFQHKTGVPIIDCINSRALDAMIAEGYLELGETHLKALKSGLIRLNSVLQHLLDDDV